MKYYYLFNECGLSIYDVNELESIVGDDALDRLDRVIISTKEEHGRILFATKFVKEIDAKLRTSVVNELAYLFKGHWPILPSVREAVSDTIRDLIKGFNRVPEAKPSSLEGLEAKLKDLSEVIKRLHETEKGMLFKAPDGLAYTVDSIDLGVSDGQLTLTVLAYNKRKGWVIPLREYFEKYK